MAKPQKQNTTAIARVERDVEIIDLSKQELEKRREVQALESEPRKRREPLTNIIEFEPMQLNILKKNWPYSGAG